MTILITGAASGIGLDSAIALSKRGHHVIATARSSDGVDKLETLIRSQNLKNLEADELDITNQDHIDRFKRKRIDVLINNAGIGESGPIAEIPLERIEQNYRTNVFGTLAVTQPILSRMIKDKAGRIITVSSVAGRLTVENLGVYCSTKHALESLFDGLRRELRRFNIKVVLIEPGLIYTGFNERMAAKKFEWLKPTSAYANQFDAWKQHDANLPKNSDTTASVVNAIIKAVEATNPKARYPAPWKYKVFLALLNLLPTAIQDRIL